MKYIATFLLAFVAATLSAQVVRIETENGTKVYDLSMVKSISFSDEKYDEKLVEMEVLNATPIAFDLRLTKSVSCQKYMVTVAPKSTFNESDFVFSAEQTLDETAYYRPYLETLSYGSHTYAESQLGINSLVDSDGKPQTLVAAVYAIDDMGRVQVLTHEFTLPETLAYESALTMKVEVGEVAYNHYTYTVSQQGWTRPAKIIYGSTQPEWMNTTIEEFNALSHEGQRDFLLGQGLGLPRLYNTKITTTVDCESASDVILYAMPIDADGKVGDMTITTIKTPKPEAKGVGEFTALSYKGETSSEEDFYKKANFETAVTNAVAYRLLWAVKKEFTDNQYAKQLVEIFLNPKMGEYGMWKQFKANETQAAVDIVRQGQEYVLYGVTIDIDGNISEPIDLLTKFTGSGSIQTSPKD